MSAATFFIVGLPIIEARHGIAQVARGRKTVVTESGAQEAVEDDPADGGDDDDGGGGDSADDDGDDGDDDKRGKDGGAKSGA